MASTGLKSVFAACAAGSLMFSSSAAMAQASAPVQQPSPWAVLSVMSGGASAAALCGSAAATAAAQGPGGCVLPVLDGAPPPPPATGAVVPAPPVVAGAGMGISPLLLGLLAIAAGVGVFLAVHNNGHANSPA